MRQIGAWIISKSLLTALSTSFVLLALLGSTDASEFCPNPEDKLIVTHPTLPGSAPETRLRCGKPVTSDVVDVPPTAPVVLHKIAPRPVRVVHVVVVKKVFVKPRSRPHSTNHGPLDFLFHH
jgi:hypothetical protein